MVRRGKAIGRMDVNTVEVTGGDSVAQTLEGGAHQGGAAVAFVAETFIGHQRQAVLGEAGLQGCDLAADGAVGGLLLGGDAGIDGSAYIRHAGLFLEMILMSDVAWSGEPHVSGWGRSRRSMIGNSRSKASAMTCCSSRLVSWLTRTVRGRRLVLRRGIGASVTGPLRIARPTRQQRCSREAVAIVRAQPIPRDRYRQVKRKFCTIVGGVITPPCGVPRVRSIVTPSFTIGAVNHLLM